MSAIDRPWLARSFPVFADVARHTRDCHEQRSKRNQKTNHQPAHNSPDFPKNTRAESEVRRPVKRLVGRDGRSGRFAQVEGEPLEIGVASCGHFENQELRNLVAVQLVQARLQSGEMLCRSLEQQ